MKTKAIDLEEGDVIQWKNGEFVITGVRWCGGGWGHGPHDVYPDGKQLTLSKLKNGTFDPKQETISKYADDTGCFIKEAYLGSFKWVKTLKRTYT